MRFLFSSSSAARLSLVCLTLASPTLAQETRTAPPANGLPADVRAARDLVFGAYPDLIGRPVNIEITPIGDSYAIRVTDAPAQGEKASALPSLVSAFVSFDAQSRLKTYTASGVLLEDARNQALRQQLAAHPEWQESDIDLYLQQITGRSAAEGLAPPAQTAEKSRAALGATATIAQAPTLRLRSEAAASDAVATERVAPRSRSAFQPPPAPPNLPPPPASAVKSVWVVEATTEGANGETARYRLEYEPISGRLVGAVRQ
jgi:hypothetical protein